ncbi:hypothetical protein GWK47_020496 [Chionoecetes opilio]|uniref:Uncharacterized protein n=1 Tax=Chionoecetes opilio TaxID=41210 RepID=A0A8J4XPN3_CHIOP|nr:hypothetical protein GWK47_020496 [Chionoecetes opilio]
MKLYGKLASVVALVTVGVTLMEVQESNATRILMAMPIGTRSHMNFFMPIAEHLVQRNHTVTYLSAYESSNKHPYIRVIFVPDIQIYNNMQQLFTTDSGTAMLSILDDMRRTCIKALAYEGVQRLMDEKFDLDAECRAQKLCPEDMPSLQELNLNRSLLITNRCVFR